MKINEKEVIMILSCCFKYTNLYDFIRNIFQNLLYKNWVRVKF